MQDMLRRAVVYIQAGEREEGKHLLTLVVQVEPDNATAWLWLAAVADTEAERLDALQRVVQIDPDHALGRRAQAMLRREVIKEVATRLPPPTLPRTIAPPRAAEPPQPPAPTPPALQPPRPYRATHPTTMPPAERPRARRGRLGLLVFGIVAASLVVSGVATFTLYSDSAPAPLTAPTTRVIVERTRAPATPRPPTQPPLASATPAPPPPPSVTPNARYGACGRDPALATQPSFLCLDSEPGDPVGGGAPQQITPATGAFTVAWNNAGAVEAHVQGTAAWDLVFQVPYGLQLHPGGSIEQRTFGTPVPIDELGLTITGGRAACAQATGRVSILILEYEGNQITRFAADFEQHCMGDAPGLYGSILYQAGP